MSVTVNIETRALRTALRKAEQNATNLTHAWDEIGQMMLRSVTKNFDVGGRPKRWPVTKKKEGRKTLIESGRLKGSVTKESDSKSVTLGSNLKYAAIHQFGGKTKAHVIRPKNKKFLYWPGAKHPVRFVNHPGSDIPARPYLVVQEDDWRKMARIIEEHVEEPLQ